MAKRIQLMSKKKKILFIMPTLGGGGAERVVCNIANNLDQEKYDINIFLIMQGEHVYVQSLASHINVIYGGFTMKLKYCIPLVLITILREKPDIVFSGLGTLNALISPFVPFFRKIKWIARETNTVSVCITNKVELFLVRKFYNNFHVIIAQCNDMKNDLVNNFQTDSNIIKIINNPVDTDFIDIALQSNSSDAKTHFDNEKINLVVCGRLSNQKGFDLLLREFASLSDIEKYHLTIIGKNYDNYLEDLNQIIEEELLVNKVSILPFKGDIHAWLKEADIFILSSRFEGFPNILLEAIYCGLPALANNCPGGITEIINDDNGLIFDFNIKNSFQKSLQEIQMIKFNKGKVKETVKSRYDTNIIIPRFEENF